MLQVAGGPVVWQLFALDEVELLVSGSWIPKECWACDLRC